MEGESPERGGIKIGKVSILFSPFFNNADAAVK